MSDLVVYHNPRCSKSREVVALLTARGAPHTVILYMDQGLQAGEIRELLPKLGLSARALLRTSEAAYRERGLADVTLSEDVLVQSMVEEPKLFQRPVVVSGGRAVIARPADRALELLV